MILALVCILGGFVLGAASCFVACAWSIGGMLERSGANG